MRYHTWIFASEKSARRFAATADKLGFEAEQNGVALLSPEPDNGNKTILDHILDHCIVPEQDLPLYFGRTEPVTIRS